jgi:hypothetical protein
MATFTLVHVVVSLLGIGAGLIVMSGLLGGRRLDGWNALFLASTAATSATGFGFPFGRLLPSHVVGSISLLVLAVAILARYTNRLVGPWRTVYVVSATVALYLNVFVGIVQAFQKVPALRALAPTQSEAPFIVAQLAALAIFATIAATAIRRFRVETRPVVEHAQV